MARKLKSYVTSAGFFDLAIAAPSMKAALDAWGSRNNLFHHGFATVSDDPGVVAATMAKPGVVLRRPVGSDRAFSERADLPTDLVTETVKRAPARRARTTGPPPEAVDEKSARKKRGSARRPREKPQEKPQRKERERRERAVAAAEAALVQARRDHEARVEDIARQRAALDRESDAQSARWAKKKERLDAALRRARSARPLPRP